MAQRQSKREKKKLIYLPDGVVVDEYKWTKMLEAKNEAENAKITSFTPLELKGIQKCRTYNPTQKRTRINLRIFARK
jgi:hypothetical protein